MANFNPCFEGVIALRVGHILAALEEIAVGLHHRSACIVEGFK